ncbi:MAG: short-chain dehydrogenase, partial [Firmicutes bacterium]|nr:short-chain dehydrogenase [Bacillota bacterium]
MDPTAVKHKVAVVTGGGHGIGLCVTQEFRKIGVTVYVIDKNAGDWFVGDVGDQETLEAFVQYVME